jgi:hypothetical protein
LQALNGSVLHWKAALGLIIKMLKAVLRIRIRMFLGLLDPDPDPLVKGMDPDPDRSITKQKK